MGLGVPNPTPAKRAGKAELVLRPAGVGGRPGDWEAPGFRLRRAPPKVAGGVSAGNAVKPDVQDLDWQQAS